ncbi:hypothetical protein AB0M32_14665 [Streptomyces sp. NPDC051985]|uniref:hypothetical protein n=1 Tax=Streptomyces sp. NPDC051985 TaxID=3155807 RepID=UPI0034349C83
MSGGPLGMSVKTTGDRPAGHDLVVVIGAEVFRYHPYVPGPYLSDGTEFLQITGNPAVAAAALMGDSLLGDPGRRSSSYWTWAGGRADRSSAHGAPPDASPSTEQPADALRSTPSRAASSLPTR